MTKAKEKKVHKSIDHKDQSVHQKVFLGFHPVTGEELHQEIEVKKEIEKKEE